MGPPFVWIPSLLRPATPPLLQNCDFKVGSMSGADKACRHFAQLVRRGFLARAKSARAFARNVPENAAECSKAVPARLEGDLGDGEVRVAQQRLCPLQPAREQVSV